MELVDIVDENNKLTGQVEDRWVAYNKGLWRRTVSCWIINEKGEILLQKRTANKLKNPNKWAKTGGQVDSGETVEEAIFREVKEELGIEIVQEKFLKAYNRYTDFFNEVNDFCIMVNIGAIKAENYIKNTISVNLSKYATIQYDTFASLQGIAHKYGFEELRKPDYKAFEDYDKFLIAYNGGENSAFWTDIKTKRRQNGFE